MDKIIGEQRRLQQEEKRAETLLVEYQQKASEALARLSRVRRQREFLVDKGAVMVARGLSSLDELEAAERIEQEEAAQAAQAAQAISSSNDAPPSDPAPSGSSDFP